MCHFVWELLNSHATYVWSFDKDSEGTGILVRRVEDAINQVRNSGRESYKMAYRNRHLDHDLVFHVVRHDQAGSALVDGFVSWRHRLEQLLV